MATNKIDNIVVLGASITDCPWHTWKDFVEIETGLPVHNLATIGAGNEYMVHTLCANQAMLTPSTMVMCMFTNIDKFDWYVTDKMYHDLASEKHPPKAISDHSGFWCTGSWFPLQKEIYQTTFYTEDYFCTKTIQQILLLKSICNQHGSKLVLLFDSPIWTLTDQTIFNSIVTYNSEHVKNLTTDFLSMPLSSMWAKCLEQEHVDISETSLLGFCWKHGLPWRNNKYNAHPPSSSHWQFYKDIIKPQICNNVSLKDTDFTRQVKQFDKEWTNFK